VNTCYLFFIVYKGHGDRNSIILERDNGDVHYVDSKSLEDLLQANDTGCICSVAFVSACHSEEAGKKFVSAGVRHVVCVKESEFVSDSSSLTFAKLFYSALFQGKSVKSSFDIGLRTVMVDESVNRQHHVPLSPRPADTSMNSSNQHNHPAPNHDLFCQVTAKYLLLPVDSLHDDIIFPPQHIFDDQQYMFIDETKRLTINHCDHPPSKFISRKVDMQLGMNVATICISQLHNMNLLCC